MITAVKGGWIDWGGGGIARYPAIPEKHRCDRYSDTLQRDGGGGGVERLSHSGGSLLLVGTVSNATLARRHFIVCIFCSFLFSMGVRPRKEICAVTKAASIPARRQSENAGPRLFWIYFSLLPPSRIFFPIFELIC